MGFVSYRAYLRSALWDKIRKRVLRVFPECELCGKPPNNIHHMTYSRRNLSGKTPWKLVVLCRDCHKSVEFTETEEKLSKKETERLLRNRLKKVGKLRFHKKQAFLELEKMCSESERSHTTTQ
jgi:5-methylcytosine-specific restriction endonuclease McrA